MRLRVANDLHATARTADEVSWRHVREQVLTAELLGLDLVVLPDHLSYRAGGQGDYALPDEAVGVRESLVEAAALAASTTRIVIGHSVINAPYRTPTMLAHVAATLADVSGGRYSLGIGVGNSFDYDQVGVAADARVTRFAESVEIVSRLLRDGHADVDGAYWTAAAADLVLGPVESHRPPLVVAAGGPRTMDVAVRFADAWNGFCPTDPDGTVATDLLAQLDRSCAAHGRNPASIARTFDLGVDPMDLQNARGRSIEMLGRLAELGVDEARCYAVSTSTHVARLEAIEALAQMATEI